ncbi:LacI family DNA-binding transcriptional regulator [Kocuria marina]|uniref:substrate-binding domain-containing protein n=1 Tax=Kocuria marina TaxID=223184 RepID=UPI0023688CC3|nr:LacI family DNA-binding transcriptional regulator [Kocuria indica]
MSTAGLPIHDRDQLVSDFTFLGAYQQVKNLLAEPEQRPTAVFAATDEMAAGAILAARDLGLDVPRDLSAIGIDAHPLGEAFGLTTIDQQAHHQGTRAAQLLLRQLAGESVTAGHALHRAHFIARSSTAPPGSKSSPA